MGRANAPLLVALALLALGCGASESASIEGNSSGVGVTATLQACPTISTLTAIPSNPNTAAPDNTSTIRASAAAPNPATLKYTFSVKSGRGTLSEQKNASDRAGTSSSVVFACPATDEVDTIQLVTSDETGAKCAASLTTATTQVTCGTAP
jgi:hypothetical protein